MTTDYIALARDNREKALAGLKHSRRQILALPGYAVYPRTARRVHVPVFMSSRIPGPFALANLH